MGVRVEDLSPIEHTFERQRVSDLYQNVLVVSFRGEVRAGAAGMTDARLLEAWIGFGMTLFGPDALILDLRALRLGAPLPRRVITAVEPDLEEGFPLYLVRPPDGDDRLAALPASCLCDSLEQALAKIGASGPWALR